MTARRLMIGFWLVCTALKANTKVSLDMQESWNNLFGGREAVLHVRVIAQEAIQGRIVWSYAAGNKTIARQEREASATPSQGVIMEIRLPVPDVKENVILNSALTVALFKTGAAQPAAILDKTLWVFPDNPFAVRQEWLKGLGLHLFDPEMRTGTLFEKAHIPFRRIAHIDGLIAVNNGIVVIGEGIAFKDYRGLWDQMVKLASSGVSVLCLAPNQGNVPLLAPEKPDSPQPGNLKFEGIPFIEKLDKRLDAGAWPPDGVICTRTVSVRGEQRVVAGEVAAPDKAGWPWIELEFNHPHGRLILCCFAIVEKWEVSPAPRFLLKRIWEYIDDQQERMKP